MLPTQLFPQVSPSSNKYCMCEPHRQHAGQYGRVYLVDILCKLPRQMPQIWYRQVDQRGDAA